jgi:hypothetical protein
MVICVVEEEEVHTVVLICQVLIQPGVDDVGKRSGMTLVGYEADKVRLGKKEEEALRQDGHDDNNNGYRGGGGGRGRWKGQGDMEGEGGEEGEEVS